MKDFVSLPGIESGFDKYPPTPYSNFITEEDILFAIEKIKARIIQLKSELVTVTTSRDKYAAQIPPKVETQIESFVNAEIQATIQSEIEAESQFEIQPSIPSEPSPPSLMAGFPSWAIIPLAGMALFMLFGKKKKGRGK